MGRATLVALAAVGLVALSACGDGDPAPSPTATATAPAPTAALARLAHRFRSAETMTQTWWVKLPLSEAKPVLGDEFESLAAGRQLSFPLYLVILNGDYTGGDGTTHYDWAVLVPDPGALDSGDMTLIVMAERPEIPGRVWNRLPWSSP